MDEPIDDLEWDPWLWFVDGSIGRYRQAYPCECDGRCECDDEEPE